MCSIAETTCTRRRATGRARVEGDPKWSAVLQPGWEAIASRVRALQAAAAVYFPAVQTSGSDYYGASNRALIPLARETYRDIEALRTRYANQLSPSAVTAIDEFLARD